MIKITLVAPYEELSVLAYETFKAHMEFESSLGSMNSYDKYKLNVVVGNSDKMKHVNFDADVIISRGGAAVVLRNCNPYIPVVEIPLAGNDLIRCIHESKQLYGSKQVGVIGPMNMTYGVEGIADIVGLSIKAYTTTKIEQIPALVERAADEGCQIIIGGIQAKNHAISLGLQASVPRTGKDSLWQAITEAKRVACISRMEQEKAQLFKTILDYAYEGVIAVNKEDAISVFNASAQNMLRIPAKETLGKKFGDIIPKCSLQDIIRKEGEHLDEIIEYDNIRLAITKVPIMLKNENVGNVFTFQDVTKVQELEGKIRKEIHARGHIAKHTFHDIIGKSEKIKETIITAKRFSKVNSNILIIGETGTGKELFAQSIHSFSPRKDGPFVAVNCAALPENLLESELFGYVEGAFTGAAKGGKPGLFELAHKGTIFLDEIAEISLKLQGRLLRVIQEKEIMRLGHDRVIPIDVRIISATNKNLYEMVEKGDYREDLYYRLDVLKLHLPSLNERREDISLIVENFMHIYKPLSYFKDVSITESAMRILQDFNWRGNVRELGNICENLTVLSQSSFVDEKDVKTILVHKERYNTLKRDAAYDVSIKSEHDHTPQEVNGKLDEGNEDSEKQKIREALECGGYCKTKAAKRLGISRTTLWRKMKELEMI
ncbi:MAG: sigma 54-interacting transcriptional regulator [Clostridia bacterium]